MKADRFGYPTGGVRTLLRLEGAAVFLAATLAYFADGGAWWLYLVLLLAPDLAFIGYGAGERLGAMTYNAAHTIVAPVVLVAGAWAVGQDLAFHVGLIWLAHIGMDRMLGYGLKYPGGSGQTHLGPMGKAKAKARVTIS